ncbi:MAG: hypothetical protein WDA70_03605 [Lysobacteraceae bacterium]
MSRRRVLLMAMRPSGPAVNLFTHAFSSDRVAFAIPVSQGNQLPLRARISGQDDVVIERSASVWPFDRAPTQKAGTISLLNGDRALDSVLAASWRDALYQLRWCWDDEAADPGHSWDACPIWQSGVIDSMSTTDGDRRIVFALADPLARWDVPLQTDLYPDNAPNAAARGKPKPITLGTARFAPGALRDTTDIGPDAWSYDLHDGHLAGITAIYDKGDIFTTADWIPTADRQGFKLNNKPDNPVTASIEGATVVMPGAASTTWDFKDGPWAGGTPVGWMNPAGNIQQTAQGIRLYGASASLIWTTTDYVLPGKRYRADLDVATVGVATTRPTASSFSRFGDDRYAASSPGVWPFYSSVHPSTSMTLGIYAGADLGGTIIRGITLTEVQLTDRLPAFMHWIAQSKNLTGSLDTAAITALDTAAPYLLGTYQDTPITALTLLRRALDGWCGWVTSTRDGRLTVGRLRKRGGTTGSVRLGRGQIITVRRRTDTAPGLATRLAGLRNHHVHSDGDIATSVDGALRAELQSEYTIKTGSTPMPTAYAHADGADPQPTLLQDAAQLQAAADHVTDLFGSGPMTWYELDAAISSEIADGLEMGDWIHVTHPVAGLDAGKWLCLMGATIRFRGRRATLTLLDIPE